MVGRFFAAVVVCLSLAGCVASPSHEVPAPRRPVFSSPSPGGGAGVRAVRVEVEPPAPRLPLVGPLRGVLPLGRALAVLKSQAGGGWRVGADYGVDLAGSVVLDVPAGTPLDEAVRSAVGGLDLAVEVDGRHREVRVCSRISRTWRLPVLNLAETAEVDLVAGGDTLGTAVSSSSSSSAPSGTSSSSVKVSRGLRVTTKSVVKDPWRDVEVGLRRFVRKGERLVVDRVSGTVTVEGRPSTVEAVERHLRQVVEAYALQVEMQVTVFEVELSSGFALGVDWKKLAGAVAGGWRTGAEFLGAPAVPGEGGSGSLRVIVGYGGVEAVLAALETFGRVRVLARPTLRVASNATAQLFVGETVPYLSRYESTVTSETVQRVVETGEVRTGLGLSVTPYVARSGAVLVSLAPAMSELERVAVFKPAEDVEVSRPHVKVREMRTVVGVRPGEAVLMGGLIYERASSDSAGLPWLRRAGFPWERREEARRRVELVIYLKPKVIRLGEEELMERVS